MINFEIDNDRLFQISFEYLSEYQSSGVFMSSEENLCGKSYALNQISWEKQADSSITKTYVNLTREGLSNNATLAVSTLVFPQNQMIKNQSISALSEAYLEMTVNNWHFSESVSGLALNLNAREIHSQNYEILGPYFNFTTQRYNLEIINSVGDVFVFVFKPTFLIVTEQGNTEEIELHPFAEYNIASYNQIPADFWLSLPYQEDSTQIIFGLVCKIIKNPTKTTGMTERTFYLLAIIMFIITCYSSKFYKKRLRRNK
ncbi:MAG: hypothetical protein GF308_05750 [Candidatus Heimdallarchaeota archaeon]|nr:hypothetical protein [Candidatus Heimdallarchaeota archaeon]